MIERYALGCAFSTKEVFENFPTKKLKINCKECRAITGDMHKSTLVRRVFMASLKLVIEDVIENNATFWLPLTNDRKCNIHMRRVTGEAFKKLRQAGKWQDVDITKSFFTGYEIGFYMTGFRTPRDKTVYVNKKYRDRITLKTNAGFPYGDSNKDRTIKDYIPKIQELFPTVSLMDIRRILSYCWKAVFLHNSFGGDTVFKDSDIWCYIGYLKGDPRKHFCYYIMKLIIKLRVLYKRRNIAWDGYYYFALEEEKYLEYRNWKKLTGRNKYFDFGTVTIYKILDECKIRLYYNLYIFRIPYISSLNMRLRVYGLVTNKAELIITRSPLKFKDILIYDNEYEFL